MFEQSVGSQEGTITAEHQIETVKQYRNSKSSKKTTNYYRHYSVPRYTARSFSYLHRSAVSPAGWAGADLDPNEVELAYP